MKVFEKKRAARKLSVALQMETSWAAREHMVKRSHISWGIPDDHVILKGKNEQQRIGMAQIWFETVKQ